MIELFLTTKVNVYNYSVTSSGVTNIGGLIRTDNNKGYRLDLFEGEKIPITYQIQDAIDPSKKKAPYSKNFLIPGTKRNSIALEFPYMISSNVQYSLYNGSVVETGVTGIYEWHLPVQEAQLYVDSILAFTGQLELSRAIINNGEVNSFEVNFMATQINIFDELQNKNMRDLDLPTPQIASTSGISAAYSCKKAGKNGETFNISGQTYEGWTIAYPDWGFSEVGATGYTFDKVSAYATTGRTKVYSVTQPTDRRDCGLQVGYNFTFYAFATYLIDKIFEGIDFSYESNFFNSDPFQSYVLFCYDSKQLPSNTQFKLFGSNPTSTTYFPDQITSNTCPDPVVHPINNFSGQGQVPSTSPFNANESLADPFVVFQAGTFQFPNAGVYNVRLRAVVDIRFGWDMLYNTQGALCPGGTPNANVYPWATASLLGPDSEIYFYNPRTGAKITQNIAGLAVDNTALATPSTYIKSGITHYQWETSHDAYSTFLNYTLLVQEGDIWELYFKADSDNYCNQAVAFGCNAFPISQRKYEAALDVLAVDVSPFFHNWNQTLPNISQKDFLSAIFKHFNLYTEILPNSRIMTIEPRDDFFNFGNVQDWTNKLDLATVREISRSEYPDYVIARMANTQNRFDKPRQEATVDKLEAGSNKVFLQNGKGDPQEFKSSFGTLTLDKQTYRDSGSTIFYTTQISGSEGFENIPNASLYALNSDGTRILTQESDMFLGRRSNTTGIGATGTVFANYYLPGTTGYIGSVSAQYLTSQAFGGGASGSVDINYRTPDPSWADGGVLPSSWILMTNAYDEYYRDYYLNLTDQKILKAQVRLEPADIARFSFRNPIWITFPNGDGDYFIVDSIQYDPTSYGNATVQLLTFNKEYFNFTYESVSPFGSGPDYPAPAPTGPAPALPPDQSGGGEYPIKGEA